MKVLVFSWHRKDIKHRLHLGFLENLRPHCKELIIYDRFKTFEGTRGRSNKKIKVDALKVYEKHKPDVAIVYSSWNIPPTFFTKLPCLKICIETDFYRYVKKQRFDWFIKNKFDYLIQRGAFSPKKNTSGIPMVWLPFSADTKEFYPGSKRNNKIGFAGATKPPAYVQRRKAIAILSRAKLLWNAGRNVGQYPEFVRKCTGLLTSTESHSPHGKVFEAMASKTVVLTPPFYHENDLFEPNAFVKYKSDCSNIAQQARKIINEPKKTQNMADKAYKIFLEKHTHQKRAEELSNHLKNLLAGKDPEKYWGI